MQCRQHFLDGLDKLPEATRINPIRKSAEKFAIGENDVRIFADDQGIV